MDILSLACNHIGVSPEQVVAHRTYTVAENPGVVTADEVVVLIDYGVSGIKKYRIPLAILTALSEPDIVLSKADGEGEDLSSLSLDQLKAKARAKGVRGYASMKRSTLIERIKE